MSHPDWKKIRQSWGFSKSLGIHEFFVTYGEAAFGIYRNCGFLDVVI
jgi:hypothetical protein